MGGSDLKDPNLGRIKITYMCMGTVESRPEPLLEYLGKGPSQPWEHR